MTVHHIHFAWNDWPVDWPARGSDINLCRFVRLWIISHLSPTNCSWWEMTFSPFVDDDCSFRGNQEMTILCTDGLPPKIFSSRCIHQPNCSKAVICQRKRELSGAVVGKQEQKIDLLKPPSTTYWTAAKFSSVENEEVHVQDRHDENLRDIHTFANLFFQFQKEKEYF